MQFKGRTKDLNELQGANLLEIDKRDEESHCKIFLKVSSLVSRKCSCRKDVSKIIMGKYIMTPLAG